MKNALINFWKKHRRAIILIGVVSIAVTVLLPHLAFAQDAASSVNDKKLEKSVLEFINLIGKWLTVILWPFLLMIGGLMNNDLLFGAGMEERSLLIWQQIRNLVNILFVLILLGIALYNIVGGNNQSWQLKAILPKFVIALIAVNFSFVGLKIVLDGVNVVSTAIFAMPNAVQSGLGELANNQDPAWIKTICHGIHGDDRHYAANIAAAGDGRFCDVDEKFTPKAQEYFAKFGSNNAAMVLAVNFMNIGKVADVNLNIPDVTELTINGIFSVVFYLVYAISFIALMIVLLVRVIVLWLLLVLSPLAALSFVLPENLKKSLGEAGNMTDKFVQHAIVPIPIALVMTIGFIMLSGLKAASFPGTSLTAPTLGLGLLVSGVTTFQQLIMNIAAVGFIWTGVFAAAKNTMAAQFTDKLKGMAETAGKFVGTAWQYAPIIPIEGKKDAAGNDLKISLASAMGMGDRMEQNRSRQREEELNRAMPDSASPYADAIMRAGKDRDLDTVRQKVADARGENQQGTPRVQFAIADAMKNDQAGTRKEVERIFKLLDTDMKIDTDGKEMKTIEDLEKKLKDGKVKPAAMEKLTSLLAGNKTPETLPVGGEKPTAGTSKSAAEENADDIISSDTAGYGKSLNDADVKAIEKYKNAKPEEKKAAAEAAHEALDKLDALIQEGSQTVSKIANATKLEDLTTEIQARRQKLIGQGIKDSAKQNEILQKDCEAAGIGKIQKLMEGKSVPEPLAFLKSPVLTVTPAPAATPATPTPPTPETPPE